MHDNANAMNLPDGRAGLENPDPSDETLSQQGMGWKTILFNCDCHTFNEVAIQLIRAIHCSYDHGLRLANVAHHTGSAVVYYGHRERCEAVAEVLKRIGLITEIQS
jgi:ATP-dependent Clp protease adaptor protein ClpS